MERHRMNLEKRASYVGLDGSRWYIARHLDIGHAFLQHIPGDPSGGQASHIALGTFLNGGA